MTDDPSSPSKKLVRETRTKNSVRLSCIHARVFSHARNLFGVGHSSIPSKFLVRVSRTSFLDGELGSSVMGLRPHLKIGDRPFLEEEVGWGRNLKKIILQANWHEE